MSADAETSHSPPSSRPNSTSALPSRPTFLRFGSRPAELGPGETEDQDHVPHPPPLRRSASRLNYKSRWWNSRREKKNDVLACVGEFFGTFIFLYMAFAGAQSASFNRGDTSATKGITTNDNQTILYIALSFGMSLIVTAWVFFRITGSAFNPAVTLSLWLIGNLTGRRAVMISIAQYLGGIAAAGVAKGLTLGDFSTENTTTGSLSAAQGLFIEMFTTTLLCFTVMMTAAEKSKATFLAPVAIGLALFCGHLASVGWTGAGINPARTFGPSVVNGHFTHNAYLYYIGQYLGSLLATAAYVMLKQLHYVPNEVVGDVETADASQSQQLDNSPAMTGLHAVHLRSQASMVSLHRTVSKREKSGSSEDVVQTV